MTPADLVAVASIGSSLQMLQRLHERQGRRCARRCRRSRRRTGRRLPTSTRARMATDEATTPPTATDDDDRRRERAGARHVQQRRAPARAEDDLPTALAPIQQKKAILYFSSGMQRNGTDNQVELRAAVNAARSRERHDLPGRLARPAGGRRPAAARVRAAAAASAPSTVARSRSQFTQLAAQQETLTDARGRHRRHGASPIRTTSARRSTRSRRTSRRTTSSATRARTRTRTGATGASRCSSTEPSTRRSRRAKATTPIATSRTPPRAIARSQLQEQLIDADSGDRRPAVRHRRLVPAARLDLVSGRRRPWRSGRRTRWSWRARRRPGRPLQQDAGSNCYYVPMSLAVPGDAVPPSKAETVTLDVARLHPRRARPAGRDDQGHDDGAAGRRRQRSRRSRCSIRPA